MTQLNKIIGQMVKSVSEDREIDLAKSIDHFNQLNILLDDYQIVIYNKYEFRNIKNIKDIENKKITAVLSSALYEKICFSNNIELIIRLDDESYSGPEAMQLIGPNNLIVIWN